MALHAEAQGRGPRLVLVHGFTQDRRCWGPEVEALGDDHEVVRVDAPGHGASSEERADLDGGAQLLGDAGGSATYLGYSMGARLCLTLALSQPGLVRGLVLVGGTAGIEDPAERAARAEQDDRTARRLEEVGLGPFLDEWLDQPMFRGIPVARAFRSERAENTVAGLASSLRLAGTGSQPPYWDRLSELTMPVLVVAGDRDEKFAALGARMVAAIGPSATLALVEGAGHAAHLEQPERFVAAVRPWLTQHDL
jgi:2-succinyl-6-hydroxy-2,4-cyclohexadiene-1-carboxylate synthase